MSTQKTDSTLPRHPFFETASDRLVVLNRESKKKDEQESAYISALLNSLPTLTQENREGLLNQTAFQMDITRQDVDQFIKGYMTVRKSGTSI